MDEAGFLSSLQPNVSYVQRLASTQNKTFTITASLQLLLLFEGSPGISKQYFYMPAITS